MARTYIDPTLTPSLAPTNILDNGGFEIWQRGISFAPPSAYTADRWNLSSSEMTNTTVTRETTNVDTVGLYSLKAVIASSTASKLWRLYQIIENFESYRGKAVTVTARVKTTVANAVRVALGEGLQVYSSYHTGSGNWETLTATAILSPTSTALNVYLGMIDNGDKKDGTYYFDSAMLTIGPSPVSFIPTNPQVDLARCQRFYQQIGGLATNQMISTGPCDSTTSTELPWVFPVPMRSTPTVTPLNPTHFQVINSAGGGIATTSVGVGYITLQSFYFNAVVASGLTSGACTRLVTTNVDAVVQCSADL